MLNSTSCIVSRLFIRAEVAVSIRDIDVCFCYWDLFSYISENVCKSHWPLTFNCTFQALKQKLETFVHIALDVLRMSHVLKSLEL